MAYRYGYLHTYTYLQLCNGYLPCLYPSPTK
uniref:Uncharacterized protein n=1 Tax=Anguilla anguilla TaxID=7936 RepID=A0A0E9S8Q4_ANGAN